MPKFKNDLAELDYQIMPKALRTICDEFEAMSLFFGITPIVTRVRDAVACDSGVHEAGRGVDFRDQHVLADGSLGRLYTIDQVEAIVTQLNQKYTRSDDKPTCLHHSFHESPMHFHIQLEADKLLPGEPLPRPDPPQAA